MKHLLRIPSRGFTIFFATLISSLALAIGLVIFDLTIRELDLSATATQSQYAIYAADTGAECALYWNSHYGVYEEDGIDDLDGSAFGTSTTIGVDSAGPGEITCASQDIVAAGTPPAPFGLPPDGWTEWDYAADTSGATTTFTMILGTTLSAPCVTVEVAKRGTPSRTTIVSHGHNTCRPGVTQLERALQVNL